MRDFPNPDCARPGTGPLVLVFMGVSGCGKSTAGALLAGRLGWPFEEGDALHPQSNIDKMHAGIPLDDADRLPWLERVASWIEARLAAEGHGIITCSALKRSYRELLDRRRSGVVFVYLAGDKKTISARLAARVEHFMAPGLLDSQFAALEEPQTGEPFVRVDVGPPPHEVVQKIVDLLKLGG